MNTLSQFFAEDMTRPQKYQDFIHRYQQDPAQLVGSDIVQLYADLAQHLDEREMDGAHERAFGQMSNAERRVLAQQFQYAGRDPTRSFTGYPAGTPFEQMMQPRRLGRMTRHAAHHDRDLLEELLGATSPLDSSGTKLALANTTVTLVSRYMQTH